jgi:hypothetical protein
MVSWVEADKSSLCRSKVIDWRSKTTEVNLWKVSKSKAALSSESCSIIFDTSDLFIFGT